MTFITQLIFGSLLLGFCAFVHIGLLVFAVSQLDRVGARFGNDHRSARKITVIFSVGLGAILLAHTLQIWAWAGAFLGLGAAPDFETAFYFATVTYTTLGYGDIAPIVGQRVFVTFAAITGLLTFGISTAFLIGLIVRLLPDVFGDDPKD